MKRHANLSKKQIKGQFFTKNASALLQQYAHLVQGKSIIDPFAGGGDLLTWALSNGAAEVSGFDIEPAHSEVQQRDSLLDPPDMRGKFLVTNPPYLAANKAKDKRPFQKWAQSDLYKCHLAYLVDSGCDEGILILPTNFISESSPKARDLFFRHFEVSQLDYYYYPVFPDVTTGIAVFSFKRLKEVLKGVQSTWIPTRIHYSLEKVVEEIVVLKSVDRWLYGPEFFRYIDIAPYPIEKWTGKEQGFLSNIVLGLLDKGAWPQGLSYNEGQPVVCGDKSFTTYQLVFPQQISETKQRSLVEMFNSRLKHFRAKYHGLFLANFMGADQKILNRTFCHKLFAACINERRECSDDCLDPIYVTCHTCHKSVGEPCTYAGNPGPIYHHIRWLRAESRPDWIDTKHALQHGALCVDDGSGLCTRCGQKIHRLQNISNVLRSDYCE